MRITCFVLGVLCLLGAAGFLVLGTVNIGDSGSSSTPTTSSFRMAQADSPNLDDFGPATTLAQVFALAGIAWMVGAAAFAPKQAVPAAPSAAPTPAPQQWQPQQYPAQQQHPQQNQQG
jgi:hypothetical protein